MRKIQYLNPYEVPYYLHYTLHKPTPSPPQSHSLLSLPATPSSPLQPRTTTTNPPPKTHNHARHPRINEYLNQIFDLLGELMTSEIRIAQLPGRERDAQQIFAQGTQVLNELAERIQENNSHHFRLQQEIERRAAVLRGCAVVGSVFLSEQLARVCEIL
ncbi:uncharacterized protein EAF01_002747 [Botrytis porri]|uniref:uncharacterized protein n=1 Tax=Botrytis porri TaxID=87229 RepID=UPI00190135EC|nr:uncharacterized protein EAF01_002747 [Botrytis porri]KAF7911240.1 hypothetical protein EAF01_002747 [Botrytis porri]